MEASVAPLQDMPMALSSLNFILTRNATPDTAILVGMSHSNIKRRISERRPTLERPAAASPPLDGLLCLRSARACLLPRVDPSLRISLPAVVVVRG